MDDIPGVKAVHVQNINIDGLQRSNTTFVTAQLRPLFEARTSRSLLTALEDTQTRLSRLDIFRSVNLRVDRSDPDRFRGSHPYDVTASLVERREPRPWLRAGRHYGDRRLVGAGLVHGNLLGGGERLEVEGGMGVNEPSLGRVSVSKPWTTNSAVRWSVGGWVLGARQLRDEAVCAAVSVQTCAGEHTLQWEGKRRTTQLQEDDAEAPTLKEHRAILRHLFHHDSRNSRVFPSTGLYLHLNQALVGSPDSGYLVQRLDVRRWIALPWAGMVLCAGLVGGLLSSGGNKVPPLDQLTPCQDVHQFGPCATPPPLTDGLSLAQASLHLFCPVYNEHVRLQTFLTADLPRRAYSRELDDEMHDSK